MQTEHDLHDSQAAAAALDRHGYLWSPPSPLHIRKRVLLVLVSGVTIFGYGPGLTYGVMCWLLNGPQWRWTLISYLWEVPVIGGIGLVLLPWRWFRPIHRTLVRLANGEQMGRLEIETLFKQSLRYPARVGLSAAGTALVGYIVGAHLVHAMAQQPVVEIIKTYLAIPLVGGLMGSYCYFGVGRALRPVIQLCTFWVPDAAQRVRRIPFSWKVFSSAAMLILVSLGFFGPMGYTRAQLILEEQLAYRATSRLQEAVASVPPESMMPADLARRVADVPLGPRGYAFMTDATGRIVTLHPRGYHELAQEGFVAASAGPSGTFVSRVGQHRVIAFATLPSGARIYSVVHTSDFTSQLHVMFWLFCLVIFEVLVVVGVLGLYFTRSITLPVNDLTEAMRRITASDDLTQRVGVTANDELGDLADAFNRMISELESSRQRIQDYAQRLERTARELATVNSEMEELLHVVSHDLRSPLINIQGFSQRLVPAFHEAMTALEGLLVQVQASTAVEGGTVQVSLAPPTPLAERLAGVKREVEQQIPEALRFISQGVGRVEALLEALLALSRVGRKADPIEPNDLDRLVDEILLRLHDEVVRQRITMIKHPLPTIDCRRNEIRELFRHLIENAIRFMGDHDPREVEITAEETGDAVRIQVRDTGIGIDPADHERIFQIFVRLEELDTPGIGVGLAYAKKIVRSHGGTIEVASQRGGGTTMTVTLPRRHEGR